MHELSVIKALVDAINRHIDEGQQQGVGQVTVEVGSLTCVDPGRLVFCFDLIKQAAGFGQTSLRVKKVQARAKCQDCGQTFVFAHYGQSCACGSADYQLTTGKELQLTEIELS